MFTNNTRDEVTLIFLKHKHHMNAEIMRHGSCSESIWRLCHAENRAIWETFREVSARNALGKQAGSYEAIGQICDEFFAAAEPAQVG